MTRVKSGLGDADNTGTNKNFSFVGSYNKRRYIKVSTKNKATGSYTLDLKKRFAIPEVTGIKGQGQLYTDMAAGRACQRVCCLYLRWKQKNWRNDCDRHKL